MALANIDHQRGARDPILVLTGFDQTRERRQDCDRKIVHAKITKILECIGSGRHSRTAQPGNDDNIGHSFEAAGFRLLFLARHK